MSNERLLLRCAATACLVLGVAGTAAAAPSWEPVQSSIQGTPTAAARDGDRTLVISGGPRRLVVTTIRAGRASATTVSRGSRRGANSPPKLFVTPRGSAVALWEEFDHGYQVRASIRGSRTSKWTAPKTVSTYPASGFARAFSAAAGPDGTVLVAWWGGPAGGRLGIYARTWKLGEGWSPAADVTGGTYPQTQSSLVALAPAVGPRGDMAVTWQDAIDGTTRRRIALRPPGGDWEPATTLGEGRIAGPYRELPLALDGQGRAVSAWLENPNPGPDGVSPTTCLHAAIAGPGGVQNDEIRCAPTAFGPIRVSADEAGNMMVGWQLSRFGPLRAEIQLAARPAGASSWTLPAPLFGDDRGYLELDGLQPIGHGRVLVPVAQGQAVKKIDEGFVRVTTVDAAGAPTSPVLGRPAMPGRERNTDINYAGYGDSAGGVLTWVTIVRNQLKVRAAILRP